MSNPPPPYMLGVATYCPIESPLLKFRRDVASQGGEDGILERIFSIITPCPRYCVEFGAWDGKQYSNTRNLLNNCGWHGCLIEGNPDRFRDLRQAYEAAPEVRCLNRFVEMEGSNTLDNILREIGAPAQFDLLSIDVDGTDYFIWQGLQDFHPQVVVIEFNPTIPNDVAFVQAKDPTVNQGASLLALILLGKQKGYELVCATAWNAFFVRTGLFSSLGVQDNHIMKLYKPILDGRIFHGYDSYIYVTGMDRLLWRDHAPLSSENFQILPPELRRFGDAQR